MPIVKHIKSPKEYEVLVWNISESNEELLSKLNLSEKQLAQYEQLSEKRKKEYLGIRSSMKEMGIEDTIFYDENGKPYLKDNVHISFSHSYGMVSVAASVFPIGVDIELKRDDKIQNIESKFIRADEAVFIPDNDLKTEYLHIIWGIKEGLYKLNGGNLWNFLHHYKVEEFHLDPESPIISWVIDDEMANKYAAFYTMVDDYYLIWVIDILNI